MSKSAIVAGFLAFFAGQIAVRAAAPLRFNYQGKLADASGNPKSGTYKMVFRIWDSATGGSLLFTDDRSSADLVPVSAGVFNVAIGSGSAVTGSLAAALSGGTNRWLEVSIAGPGPAATLQPRELLSSVPYALSVSGVAASDLTPGTFAAGTFTFPASSTVTWGNSGSRTETRDDAGLQGSAGAHSGFFETVSPVNYPAGASSWWHLLDVRHSNAGNNYALQIAGGFFDQNLYFRKTNNSASTGWSKFLAEDSSSQVTLVNNSGLTPTLAASPNESLVIRQSGTGSLHFDTSGTFFFRDSDAAFANRLTIDSSNGDLGTSGTGSFGTVSAGAGGVTSSALISATVSSGDGLKGASGTGNSDFGVEGAAYWGVYGHSTGASGAGVLGIGPGSGSYTHLRAGVNAVAGSGGTDWALVAQNGPSIFLDDVSIGFYGFPRPSLLNLASNGGAEFIDLNSVDGNWAGIMMRNAGTASVALNRESNGDFSIWQYPGGVATNRMLIKASDGSVNIPGTLNVSGSKNFRIRHPLKENMDLVHSALEGPEAAVFYRGEAKLDRGRAVVALPAYFEALTRPEDRTVMLTPLFERDDAPVSALAASLVKGGKFSVRAIDRANPSQRFYWEVKAVRSDLEPLKVEVPR